MNLQRIVSELKRERDRLSRAIDVLEGEGTAAKPRKGSSTLKLASKSRKHHLSAEGRERLSEAMKKRWAARRRGNGRAMPKAA